MLNSLNESTIGIIHRTSKAGKAANMETMRDFARPSTGVGNLVNMVNEVMDEIEG